MSKKSKKPAKRPLTRRQAEIKAAKILRGMDNSVARIRKETAAIAEGAEELKADVFPALSRAAEEAPAPKKAKPKAPSKRAKKPATKPKKAAPTKATKPKKAVAKKAAAKTAKPKKAEPKKATNGKAASKKSKSRGVPNPQDNPPVEGRPTIKEACVEIIGKKGGKCSAADLYRTAWSKWGYWSRQSLYNALKDKKLFRKVGDLYEVVAQPKKRPSGTQDAEADAFVKSVTKDEAVSQAV